MKKTPLVRRTPLKKSLRRLRKTKIKTHGFPKLKKAKLSQVSSAKKLWLKKYGDAKSSWGCYVRPADASLSIEHKDACDPHHPFGRVGERILCFLWVTKQKHHDIHDNGTKARLHGWLHPPFWGMPLDLSIPRPWPIDYEESWPEKYKRVKPDANVAQS